MEAPYTTPEARPSWYPPEAQQDRSLSDVPPPPGFDHQKERSSLDIPPPPAFCDHQQHSFQLPPSYQSSSQDNQLPPLQITHRYPATPQYRQEQSMQSVNSTPADHIPRVLPSYPMMGGEPMQRGNGSNHSSTTGFASSSYTPPSSYQMTGGASMLRGNGSSIRTPPGFASSSYAPPPYADPQLQANEASQSHPRQQFREIEVARYESIIDRFEAQATSVSEFESRVPIEILSDEEIERLTATILIQPNCETHEQAWDEYHRRNTIWQHHSESIGIMSMDALVTAPYPYANRPKSPQEAESSTQQQVAAESGFLTPAAEGSAL